tara:strand:- start:957 stop:1799 length:843 start_codon:yes stop_codon:yes gene_type:complete
MTTPFSIPNLNQYVKTGSDAELNSVTFSDGTSQTTAGGVQSKIETAGVGATGKVECTEGSVVTNIAGNIIECSASEVKLKQNLKFNDNTTQSTAFIPILHQITQKTYEGAGYDGNGNAQQVSNGNPDSDNGDSKGGLIEELTTQITMKSSTSSVKVDVMINGEWASKPFDACLCLERHNVTTGVKLVLRVATDGIRGLGISPFAISKDQTGTTLECSNLQYVDNLPANVGDVIKYSPVLVNCDTGDMWFMINRAYDSTNVLYAERLMSSVILTEIEFTSQ